MSASDWLQAAVTILGVGLGVWLAEWSHRIRERRFNVEKSTLDVSIAASHVLGGMTAGTSIETGYDSEWSRHNERLTGFLSEIRTTARWPMKNAKEIRNASSDYAARTGAASVQFLNSGKRLSWNEMITITDSNRLFSAVFGEDDRAMRLTDYYFANGPAAKEPTDEELKRFSEDVSKRRAAGQSGTTTA